MLNVPRGTILGPFDTREDWLEARRKGVGGSDIGAILGLSSYTSALEVYYAKVEARVQPPTAQMEMGRRIEAFILDEWWGDQVGTLCTDQLIIQGPWPLLHSPDALVCDGEHVLHGVEVKNIRTDRNWDPLPDQYMAQVQHGMLCAGIDTWTVVALVSGHKLITREIDADAEWQNRITAAAQRFWNLHVIPQVPPEPDGSDSAARALRGAWDTAEGKVEVSSVLWDQYLNAAAMSDYWKGEREKTIQRLQAEMGEHELATVDGVPVATWKVQTRRAVDVTLLRSAMPDIAKKFEKVSTTRVFRPK